MDIVVRVLWDLLETNVTNKVQLEETHVQLVTY